MTHSTDTNPDKPNPTPADPTAHAPQDADLILPEDFDLDKVIEDEDEDFEGDDLEADELEDEDDYDEDEEGDEEDEEDEEDDLPLPPRDPNELDAEEKARLMAFAADAVRAEDIEVLDLRPLTIIADYFVICTGKSSIQLRAIADRMEEKMRDAGIRKPRTEGYQEATWILLDYGDVVAHVMAADQRDFYRLEEFWQAAPRLDLDLLPADASAHRPIPSTFQTLTPAVTEDEDAI